MRYKGSKIARSIDNEYKKKLEWKEKTERIEKGKLERMKRGGKDEYSK